MIAIADVSTAGRLSHALHTSAIEIVLTVNALVWTAVVSPPNQSTQRPHFSSILPLFKKSPNLIFIREHPIMCIPVL